MLELMAVWCVGVVAVPLDQRMPTLVRQGLLLQRVQEVTAIPRGLVIALMVLAAAVVAMAYPRMMVRPRRWAPLVLSTGLHFAPMVGGTDAPLMPLLERKNKANRSVNARTSQHGWSAPST